MKLQLNTPNTPGAYGPSAHEQRDRVLAQRMTGGELTLGAVLVRLEEREREITAQAEQTREQIAQLTAMLDELGRAVEEVRITRKTLLELPEPGPPTPPAAGSEPPDKAAYQEILAVFTKTGGRYARAAYARLWTWTRLRTTSTMSGSSSSAWPDAAS